MEQLDYIEKCKNVLGSEYADYGLLLCKPNGKPIDPKSLSKSFKKHQTSLGIDRDEQIDVQGLRKSGQMHKVRISNNNYQVVAAYAGHTTDVLMTNYDGALEREKMWLSMLVEQSFHPSEKEQNFNNMDLLLEEIKANPQLSKELLQQLKSITGNKELCKDNLY